MNGLPSGFVRPTLCTTSWVQDYVVHHQPVLCTNDHHYMLCTVVHNFACSLSTLIVMVHKSQSGLEIARLGWPGQIPYWLAI